VNSSSSCISWLIFYISLNIFNDIHGAYFQAICSVVHSWFSFLWQIGRMDLMQQPFMVLVPVVVLHSACTAAPVCSLLYLKFEKGPTNPFCRSDVMVHSCLYTECDCLRLEKSRAQYDLWKFILSNSVLYSWNSLPNWVVSADTTNTFNARLDKFWHSQDIMYNLRSHLQGTKSHIHRVFLWRILAKNYIVEWLDEAGIEGSAGTRKFSLC